MLRKVVTHEHGTASLANKFGFDVGLNENLLNEVTNLVEYPTVILGDFEKKFLKIPDEVLITSMAKNQRFFPVFKKTWSAGTKKYTAMGS